MFFEIGGNTAAIDWSAVSRALLAADPFAQLEFEPQHGRVRIEGKLSSARAAAALAAAGFQAEHLPHETGTSTCCGSCG